MPFPIFFIITLTGFLVVKQGPSSQKKRKKSDKDTDDETAWTRAKQEEKQNSWETPWSIISVRRSLNTGGAVNESGRRFRTSLCVKPKDSSLGSRVNITNQNQCWN